MTSHKFTIFKLPKIEESREIVDKCRIVLMAIRSHLCDFFRKESRERKHKDRRYHSTTIKRIELVIDCINKVNQLLRQQLTLGNKGRYVYSEVTHIDELTFPHILVPNTRNAKRDIKLIDELLMKIVETIYDEEQYKSLFIIIGVNDAVNPPYMFPSISYNPSEDEVLDIMKFITMRLQMIKKDLYECDMLINRYWFERFEDGTYPDGSQRYSVLWKHNDMFIPLCAYGEEFERDKNTSQLVDRFVCFENSWLNFDELCEWIYHLHDKHKLLDQLKEYINDRRDCNYVDAKANFKYRMEKYYGYQLGYTEHYHCMKDERENNNS